MGTGAAVGLVDDSGVIGDAEIAEKLPSQLREQPAQGFLLANASKITQKLAASSTPYPCG